ncbi:MAG: hypothetical protein WCJ31_13290 [Planctomycetia bacterium]
MNRSSGVTLLLTFTLITVALPALAGDPRTERLIEVAQRPAPTAMDAELVVRYPKAKQSREEMVRDAESAFEFMMKMEVRDPKEREREEYIKMAVGYWEATADTDIITHKRVRYRGILYREDRSATTNGIAPLPETLYEETVVNVGNPAQGDFTSFTYTNGIGAYRTKSASIQDERGGQYTMAPVWNLLGLHDAVSFIIESATSDGDKTKGLVPSAEKTKALVEGKNKNISLQWEASVVPGTEVAADKCSVFAKLSSTFNIKQPKPVAVVWFDPADYRRDLRVELRNPYTGELATVTEKADFDGDGLPRRYVKTEYPGNGVEKSETMEVISARAVPFEEMDKSLFEFNPPDDYERTDFREPGPARWVDSKGNVLNQWQLDAIKARSDAELKRGAWSWRSWLLMANLGLLGALVAAMAIRRRKAT